MSRGRGAIALLFLTSTALALAAPSAPWTGHGNPASAGEAGELCARPEPGAQVSDPPEVRSRNGRLTVELTLHNEHASSGARFCYRLADGRQSPTLRVAPGDWVTLTLHNALITPSGRSPARAGTRAVRSDDPCTSGAMGPAATNLHFHGLPLPPRCHQDEVLKTSIPAGGTFVYRFRIPKDAPPGLYWYHPHIHGFTLAPVLGGGSGALIVEGIQRAVPQLAGLPERVFVIRDQDLVHPQAEPSPSEPRTAQLLLDADGDAVNTHTGYGRPAKDLSVNYVPVPFPDYPPAQVRVRPGERQLWRVLNAASLTYLHLALLYDGEAQRLGVVALDGVPVNARGADAAQVAWADHVGIPPGGRAEFLITTPPARTAALLVTRSVDTGASGENDPNRALAAIIGDPAAPAAAQLPQDTQPLPSPARVWLGDVTPTRVRKFYFSEAQADPGDPASPVSYFITEQGREPKVFDPAAASPDVTVHQGEVEDWIIENRSTELHAFHIHQLHFLLLDWFGLPVHEPFLRDTVNVPFYDPKMGRFPSVRLRLDFRDPQTVGTFLYHCHLLEHEDGGMMGTVRVVPAAR